MADPRAITAFEGIDADWATFQIDSTIVYDVTQLGGSASVGLAVMSTGHGIVGLTNDGAMIVGKLAKVENDGFCRVQIEGFTSLPAGNAATVTEGTRAVGALGAASARGYIRSAASAADALLAGPKIVNNADTTNVVVKFG